MCDKGFIWNPSKCECECDKSCDVGEYLDYENCKCKKKLVEECTKNVGEIKLAKTTLSENENKHKCSSCTQYIVLILVPFTTNVAIGSYFFLILWYLKKMLLALSLVPALKRQFNELINRASQRKKHQKSNLLLF